MKSLGLQNPIIEIDTERNNDISAEGWIEILTQRIEWTKANLHPDAKILVNFRDFPDAMRKGFQTVLRVTALLGSLGDDLRPFGLMYEEPTGNYLPDEIGLWTKSKYKVTTFKTVNHFEQAFAKKAFSLESVNSKNCALENRAF